MTHTAADIIRMIRATNDGEFALSFQEAELTLKLFASAAACESAENAAQETYKRTVKLFGGQA